MYYISSSGRIELRMTLIEAQSCAHPGPCDEDVKQLSLSKNIHRQLAKLDPADVREELTGYGAWSDEELADHQQNLQRLLWIAAGDIAERHA
jgi:hypothetical protein